MDTHITHTAEKPGQVTQPISLPADWLARIDSYALKLESELHFEVSQSGMILRPLLSVALEDAERVSDMMAQALKKAAYATDENGVNAEH